MTPRGVDLRKQFLSRLNHTFTGVGSRGLPITASFPNLDTIWSKPWRTLRSLDIKPASTSGFCTFVNQFSYVLEVRILDEIWRHTSLQYFSGQRSTFNYCSTVACSIWWPGRTVYVWYSILVFYFYPFRVLRFLSVLLLSIFCWTRYLHLSYS